MPILPAILALAVFPALVALSYAKNRRERRRTRSNAKALAERQMWEERERLGSRN